MKQRQISEVAYERIRYSYLPSQAELLGGDKKLH